MLNGQLDKFLASLDATEATKRSYALGAKKYAEWLEAEGLDLLEATRADTLAYKQHLINLGYRPNTVNIRLAAVRALYSWLEDEGEYDGSASRVKGVKKGRDQAKRALTRDELREVLASMPDETAADLRDYAIMLLMARRGLRTIEVARLDVGSVGKVQGKSVLWIHGKGRSDASEYVVLGAECEKAVSSYLQAAGRACAEPSEPLFTSTSNRNKSGRLTTRTIRDIAACAFERAGVTGADVTAHSLRHTAVTMALQGGADVRDAQMLARHREIGTTMIYAHDLDRIEGRAEAAVDAYAGVSYVQHGKPEARATALPAETSGCAKKTDARVLRFEPNVQQPYTERKRKSSRENAI